MNYRYFFLLVLFPAMFSCSKEPGQRKNTTQKLDSLMLSENIKSHFNGSLVVGNKDGILYQKAIGVANRVWDVPFRLDTRSKICSIDKSFIAALVLKATEEGKLSLDDRLVNLIDSDIYGGSFHPEITLHHLLTHTSGLSHYEADSALSRDNFKMFKRQHFSKKEFIDYISRIKPKSAPGEGVYYSSLSYFILAYVLERAYHQPFASLLENKISRPLGLEGTFCSNSSENIYQRVAEGYKQDKNDKWIRNHFLDESLGTNIYSSSIDLYKWGAAMYDSDFLSAKSRERMLSNHLSDISPRISYGYGWVIFDGKGKYEMGDLGIEKPYIIHGGNTEGYKSMLVNINRGEHVFAFLCNSGERINEMELARKITNILTR
ncbi:serine hydrolase (plasmid) [Fulvitalea axinellae]|uniref:Serine hydrolase n=1 Tax=Fulvitalea axinellae TaxID=1182444 RepID=A0AAU9DG43_9BACT|nr:serine hydrolase [Fulvitalea axinellae]